MIKSMEQMVKADNVVFDYVEPGDDGQGEYKIRAIDGVSVQIREGEFVAVLGHNGSGKSTFAKHLNALLSPTSGSVWIDGKDTKAEENLLKIRQTAGMVFQNPDNQIIGSIVEEDVGFGPENLGIPTKKIWERVNEALEAVGMTKFRSQSPNRLSGGQKQRTAIAGVLAMRPKCIILDEPTAMLDPNGRAEVIRTVRKLNREEKMTVILITHYMEEVIDADRIYVMDKGKIVMTGSPEEVFSQPDRLKDLRLDVPQVTELAEECRKAGILLPAGILTADRFAEELKAVL